MISIFFIGVRFMELTMQISWPTHRQLQLTAVYVDPSHTGGAVKPAKSFWYLLSWKFRGGRSLF
jgi:hypothetical protein